MLLAGVRGAAPLTTLVTLDCDACAQLTSAAVALATARAKATLRCAKTGERMGQQVENYEVERWCTLCMHLLGELACHSRGERGGTCSTAFWYVRCSTLWCCSGTLLRNAIAQRSCAAQSRTPWQMRSGTASRRVSKREMAAHRAPPFLVGVSRITSFRFRSLRRWHRRRRNCFGAHDHASPAAFHGSAPGPLRCDRPLLSRCHSPRDVSRHRPGRAPNPMRFPTFCPYRS